MQLDILAFAAHPDDVELSCSGTVIKHVKQGYKVGVVDLTKGELGSRGDAETRLREAAFASKVLGISARENLGLRDGFFEDNEAAQLELVRMIRKYQPKIVLCNAENDRHPDHRRAALLASHSCFLAGLIKIETHLDGNAQVPWRPQTVYHYIQDYYAKPNLVVDISENMDQKMESIMTFDSQFYKPGSEEPNTPISSKEFLEFIKGRALEYGRLIGVKYGEGFTTARPPGTNDLMTLL